MNEKIFKTIRGTGAASLAVGIVVLVNYPACYRSYGRNYFYYQWSQSVKT